MNSTPAHQRPEACHVCGYPEHAPTSHNYWSNADALAEARAHDARTTVRYPSGATTAEAAYVDQHRPY